MTQFEILNLSVIFAAAAMVLVNSFRSLRLQRDARERLAGELREAQLLVASVNTQLTPMERYFYFAIKAQMTLERGPFDMPINNALWVRNLTHALGVRDPELAAKMLEWGLDAIDALMEKEAFQFTEGEPGGTFRTVTRMWEPEKRKNGVLSGRNVYGPVG